MSRDRRYWLITILLLVSAVALRLLSQRENAELLKPLASFPLNWQQWRGTDSPIPPRVVAGTGVDDYLNRWYESSGTEPVQLYVGYYRSQRTGDLIHSPKNCLPGTGWQPIAASYVDVRRPGGSTARVNFYVVQKGVQRELVLYWYQSHGRIIASEYWGKWYMVLDSIHLHRTDSALVRISTPLDLEDREARTRAVAFAEQTLAYLENILP